MKRLMKIRYPKEESCINRLKSCLDMCCFPYVVFDDIDYYTVFIDRKNGTWEQVMKEVNRVHSVRFRYEGGCAIKNGELHVYCN